MRNNGTWFIKVKAEDEKRWSFLTPRGGETNLRIHASQFDDEAKATRIAAEIESENPGILAKVVAS